MNLTGSEDGTLLTYSEHLSYVFDPATSAPGVDQDTSIVTVNAPVLVSTRPDHRPTAGAGGAGAGVAASGAAGYGDKNLIGN